mmetsp:Transcript_6215/g.9071  ORF Transcript_6215/g.9071 Transcript_6215/m.9071 type:complete len:332 (-) Transcript_6215:116-1111(-)
MHSTMTVKNTQSSRTNKSQNLICWISTTFLAMQSLCSCSIEAFSLPRTIIGSSSSIRTLQYSKTTVSNCKFSSSALSLSALPPVVMDDVVPSYDAFHVVSSIYKESLRTNPFATNMITGGVLAAMGDAIAQSREKDQPYDAKRAGAFVAFDICYRALQTTLFPTIVAVCDGHFLGSLLPASAAVGQNLDLNYLAVLEQTLANQFGVIPFFYYPLFFTLTGAVQGLTMEANIERAKITVVPLLKRNWSFWIPVQYFQFGFVDEPLQIPFLCVAGLAWTCILSVAAGSVKNFNEDDSSSEGDLVVQMDYSKEEEDYSKEEEGAKVLEEVGSRR